MTRYHIPAATIRVETQASRSRFIASLGFAESVEAARAFIADVRAALPDASHHAYAFKVGFGASVTEGVSDDGEPAGTAGPPVLAVLRGAAVGDAVLVVTRYFGGTKLGTGGLVRAYSDAARAALAALTTREKIPLRQVGLTVPYPLYEKVRHLAEKHGATIDEAQFETEVTLYLTLPDDSLEAFSGMIQEISAGRVSPVLLG